MELVLIRHGEPEWVRDGLNVDDPPLTLRGHEQARRLANALQHEQFDEVLVSPLVRARQTAAPLLEALGRQEVIAPWLEEIRNPVWHGTPMEKAEQAYREARERPPHQHWSGLDGGEPVDAFQERIRLGASLFLAERGVERVDDQLPLWRASQPGYRVALVAHAGTNSVTICHLLGLPATPWEWERFVLHHASCTRVEAVEVGGFQTFALTRLSDVEHLPSADRTR